MQGIVFIALGPHSFTIHRDFLEYDAPVLAKALYHEPSSTATPAVLADVDVDVFGLLIQWIYTRSLLNQIQQPAYQHRLMALWVLAKRLEMPELQNDAVDMLEQRRRIGESIQEKTFSFVYSNTVPGDKLRLYLVDTCCRCFGVCSELVKERFPDEMIDEVNEAQAVKLEGDDGVEQRFEMEMGKYHVPISKI